MSAVREHELNLELERCRRKLKFLTHIVRATADNLDRDALLRQIVDEATEATQTDVCSIYLWEPGERVLVLTATNGLAPERVGRVKLALGEGVTGWVAAQRQALAVRDVRYESRFEWVPGLDERRFISMLSVPILSRAWVAGVINVQTVEPHEFGEDEIEFLVALAAETASILELAELNRSLAAQLSEERKAAARLLDLTGDRDDMLSTVLLQFRTPIALAGSQLDRLGKLVAAPERDLLDEIRRQLRTVQTAVDGLVTVLQQLPRATEPAA
ncbi:MAG: GAF domain-containing protein [Chloroflexi bacterium]|nr:GAF domain-containing protein [Chloroflexota bacterium]